MSQSSSPPERNDLFASAEAKADYTRRLLSDFHALEELIRSDALENDVSRIGYELELNFLDRQCEPAFIGGEVARALDDPRFTTEFSRFNLEVNSQPIVLGGRCFAQLHSGINNALAAIRAEAAKRDCSVLLTGIIPTLTKAHITPEALTPEPRYQALYEIRRALKGDDYVYRIQGIDELLTRDNIALFAGSVTSFQVHLQVAVAELVDAYNWAQLLAGPVLATAVNSPLFLGKQLWQETRIELFEQATDTRVADSDSSRNRPRVFFGDAWVRESVLELLQEDILDFDPLLNSEGSKERNDDAGAPDAAPKLEAWTLFNGTIYRWNRLCYGKVRGRPSLRIESRVLPSGPTVTDMVANAAFWTGAMAGLPARYRSVQNRLEFALVKENFFKAARYGLDVKFSWFDGPVTPRELIIDELLPIASDGLRAAGVDEDDSRRYLDIIRERTASGRTGAHWLLSSFNELRKELKPEQALQALTAGILARQDAGIPVHHWQPVQMAEAGVGTDEHCPVHRIMTTDLYKVREDDAIDLVTHLMQWKHVGHVPVETASGALTGMITRDTLLDFLLKPQKPDTTVRAGELMTACALTITPDTPLREVLALMVEHRVSCLPVVTEGRIAGLVTEHDLVRVAQLLIAERERPDGHEAQHDALARAYQRNDVEASTARATFLARLAGNARTGGGNRRHAL